MIAELNEISICEIELSFFYPTNLSWIKTKANFPRYNFISQELIAFLIAIAF